MVWWSMPLGLVRRLGMSGILSIDTLVACLLG